MGVIAALAKQHRIFVRMIDRMERALAWPESVARGEIRESLLVLLPALEKHEEIEDLVFADPFYASAEGADRIVSELKREHGRVDALHDAVSRALEDADFPWEGFQAEVAELVELLRLHFRIEEQRLWPHYARTMGRTRDRAAGRRVDKEVRVLEAEIERNRLAVSDYLSGRR